MGIVVNISGAAGERFNYEYITGSTGNAALWPSPSHLAGRASIMVFVAARSCDRCLRRVLAVWKCPTEWA
jgi:hypothetical protein